MLANLEPQYSCIIGRSILVGCNRDERKHRIRLAVADGTLLTKLDLMKLGQTKSYFNKILRRKYPATDVTCEFIGEIV